MGTATAPGQHRTGHGADAIPGGVGELSDRLKAAWWNGCAPQGWSWLMTELRRDLGADVQFWKCWETQKRGVLHLHALIWCEGVSEDRMRRAWADALSHVYRVPGGVWGWGPQQKLDRIGCKESLAEIMAELDFAPEDAAEVWAIRESTAIGHAAMYGSKYCTKGGKRAVSLNRKTGELRDDGKGYRTWSASSHWGDRMKAIRADQRAWACAGGAAGGGVPAPPASEASLDPKERFYASGEDAASAIVDLMGAVSM